MIAKWAVQRAALLVLSLALERPVLAHSLDEYLQATVISLDEGRVFLSMRLVPGVTVFPTVVRSIDTNGDEVISPVETQAYAAHVLGDLSITIDGRRARLKLRSSEFPSIDQMKEGLGEIRIELVADVPAGGPDRKLVFQNNHLPGISSYLVNCLAPENPNVQILSQARNQTQSVYELGYQVRGARR